jgi:hypothetical protein
MSSKLLIDLNLNLNYTVDFSCWVRISLHKICREVVNKFRNNVQSKRRTAVFFQNRSQKEIFLNFLRRICGHLTLCRVHVDRDVAYYISFTSCHVVVFLMQVVPITCAFDAV